MISVCKSPRRILTPHIWDSHHDEDVEAKKNVEEQRVEGNWSENWTHISHAYVTFNAALRIIRTKVLSLHVDIYGSIAVKCLMPAERWRREERQVPGKEL